MSERDEAQCHQWEFVDVIRGVDIISEVRNVKCHTVLLTQVLF